MKEYIVVFCTVPDEKTGRDIAEKLVKERLAACVNLSGSVTSFYWWQGTIEKDSENLLIIKTRREMFPELEAKITSLHPYQVPEIIALPILQGHPPYLDWIRAETHQ
ncbi:MAG: divalent cation tolerance protein CutA [Candidatus Aminicenantes bacterium]|nr:divalent cation tolerance protein CutA [Candidatus Aminicenantes bacterium]